MVTRLIEIYIVNKTLILNILTLILKLILRWWFHTVRNSIDLGLYHMHIFYLNVSIFVDLGWKVYYTHTLTFTDFKYFISIALKFE